MGGSEIYGGGREIYGARAAIRGCIRQSPVADRFLAEALALADGADAMFGAVERDPVEAGVAAVPFAILGELAALGEVIAEPLLAFATLGGLLGSGLLGLGLGEPAQGGVGVHLDRLGQPLDGRAVARIPDHIR